MIQLYIAVGVLLIDTGHWFLGYFMIGSAVTLLADKILTILSEDNK